MIIYRIRLVRRLLRRVQSAVLSRRRGFHFGSGLSVYGWPILRCAKGAEVRTGRNLVMISESVFSAVGVSRPCLLNAIEPGAKILIGDDVGMSGTSICSAVSVTIGDRVMLGADVVVTDTDFHPLDVIPRRYVRQGIRTAPVVIEDDVFVGMRSMVLKGVRIGRGSVVAAGTIVTSEVPPFTIVAGQPARVVGQVSSSG